MVDTRKSNRLVLTLKPSPNTNTRTFSVLSCLRASGCCCIPLADGRQAIGGEDDHFESPFGGGFQLAQGLFQGILNRRAASCTELFDVLDSRFRLVSLKSIIPSALKLPGGGPEVDDVEAVALSEVLDAVFQRAWACSIFLF